MVDDGREVGGPVELNLGQTDSVRLHNTFNAYTHTHTQHKHTFTSLCSVASNAVKQTHTCTKGIRGVEIKRKLVGNLRGKFKGELKVPS